MSKAAKDVEVPANASSGSVDPDMDDGDEDDFKRFLSPLELWKLESQPVRRMRRKRFRRA